MPLPAPGVISGMPAERSFGTLFAGSFFVIGLWPAMHHETPHWEIVAVAAISLLVTLVRPIWLRPLNYVWFRLGLLLHRIVSPVIMALVFFIVVTPIGLLMRAFDNDPLSLRPGPNKSSCWIARGVDGTDMRHQF